MNDGNRQGQIVSVPALIVSLERDDVDGDDGAVVQVGELAADGAGARLVDQGELFARARRESGAEGNIDVGGRVDGHRTACRDLVIAAAGNGTADQLQIGQSRGADVEVVDGQLGGARSRRQRGAGCAQREVA